MSPNQWGPKVWMFLHTLAEKINKELAKNAYLEKRKQNVLFFN